MAASFGSPTNGFIAGFNAGMTEKILIDYGRNWEKCPALGLADIIPNELPSGFFARSFPIPQAQLIDAPNAYLHPDNTPTPVQEDNRRKHEFIEWAAQRYTYSTYVGNLEKKFTAWDVEAQVINDLGNQAALNRAREFYRVVTATSTYTNAGGTGVNHTDTATNLGGGLWGAGTSANRYIQKTLAAILQQFEKSTVNGILPMEDLYLVVSPTVADVMARSQEIADGYHRQQDFSEYMQYSLYQNQLARYGLPPKLYGINLLVDPWIEKTTKVGANETRSFVAGSNAAYVMARPGGIKSASGGRAFGSFGYFTVKGEEMKTNVFDLPWDFRQLITVTDYFVVKALGVEAAYLITSVVS